MIDTIIGVVGIIIGLLGLCISWLAYKEAGSAKAAAISAAQGVKRQSIAFDLVEICQKCNLDYKVSYNDIMNIYNFVNDGIQRISGFYLQQGLEDPVCKKIISEDIESSLEAIKLKLNSLNPGNQNQTSPTNSDMDNFFYYSFSDLFSTLSGSLNKFKGALEGQLIK